jgi:hypothetical protein
LLLGDLARSPFFGLGLDVDKIEKITARLIPQKIQSR